MTTSRNLNLRMVAQAGPPSPTPPVFGFQASITSLFLSVAPHRAATSFVTATPALSFPCPGIALVPAFVKEINTFEELGVAAGMLPQEGSAGSVPQAGGLPRRRRVRAGTAASGSEDRRGQASTPTRDADSSFQFPTDFAKIVANFFRVGR